MNADTLLDVALSVVKETKKKGITENTAIKRVSVYHARSAEYMLIAQSHQEQRSPYPEYISVELERGINLVYGVDFTGVTLVICKEFP